MSWKLKKYSPPSQNKFLITMTQADMKYYFALFWVDLYKLCNELGLNGEQKKDVIAEAFVDLWKMRDTVVGYKNIKAFLYSTTRRYALELLQRETIKVCQK